MKGLQMQAEGSAAAVARWPAIVAAARTCVGTRFRPQGRVPGLGLDCVGVVLVAAAAAGVEAIAVPAYVTSGDRLPDIAAALAAVGCLQVNDRAAGDILVMAPAPGRQHLAIVTPAGVVHAHAGLARVVEGPIDPDWTITGTWRFPGAR